MSRIFTPPEFVVKNIRTLRKSRNHKGLSLAELERRTNVFSSHLCRYEIHGAVPQKENYNKLAAFFGWEAWK